jgi:ABC-type Fe3+/spermidine/putrescine transport system ATPase subunit
MIDGHPVIPWGSARLPVALNGGVPAGSSVLAVWRPEAASLIDASQAPAAALRGQVELVTFLGPITRLDVRIDDDPELVLVDLVSGTVRNISAGQEVALSVPADAIRLYT